MPTMKMLSRTAGIALLGATALAGNTVAATAQVSSAPGSAVAL